MSLLIFLKDSNIHNVIPSTMIKKCTLNAYSMKIASKYYNNFNKNVRSNQ